MSTILRKPKPVKKPAPPPKRFRNARATQKLLDRLEAERKRRKKEKAKK